MMSMAVTAGLVAAESGAFLEALRRLEGVLATTPVPSCPEWSARDLGYGVRGSSGCPIPHASHVHGKLDGGHYRGLASSSRGNLDLSPGRRDPHELAAVGAVLDAARQTLVAE